MGLEALPPNLYLGFAAAFGLSVGSFANAAIHRLPRPELKLTEPRRSQCPKCGYSIRWYENLPVISWLALRGKCSNCGSRISVRYPLVELFTGALFVLAAWITPQEQTGLLLVRWLVLASLVIATFVDFDFFEIPDEISLGGIAVAPFASLLVPALHRDTWVSQWLAGRAEPGAPAPEDLAAAVGPFEALAGSMAGIAVGGGVLLVIGWIGKRLFKADAMGFGDVKLLAAAGGFIGPGGALVSLMIASVFGSIAGVGNVFRMTCVTWRRNRRRGTGRPFSHALGIGHIVGRYLPFGPHLALGIGIVLLAWEDVLQAWPTA